jgi:hypothetical protein
MSKNYCDMSIEILQRTHDGDALDPRDLALIQCIVNAGPYDVTEAGEVAFDDLYRRATEEEYVKPWFYDIEYLTRDHIGYVYWKGRQVEHFDYREDYDGERKAALELARRCRILEARGVKPTSTTAIWKWEEAA